ncbi:hypothetical protein ACQU0X_21295 [Pseudovibrio ascidiaceicola]|uniref:hypothetical protein n=1 Tax=Pseudovibrio ascidiaceicola TaxID=285279 RepID=UPI003D35D441
MSSKKNIETKSGNRERTAAFNIYLPKSIIADIKVRADALDWRYGQYVAYVYDNVSHPDPSKMTAIDELKKINHDQARLGNLLNLALTDPDIKSKTEQLEHLYSEIRETQQALKAKVLAL